MNWLAKLKSQQKYVSGLKLGSPARSEQAPCRTAMLASAFLWRLYVCLSLRVVRVSALPGFCRDKQELVEGALSSDYYAGSGRA